MARKTATVKAEGASAPVPVEAAPVAAAPARGGAVVVAEAPAPIKKPRKPRMSMAERLEKEKAEALAKVEQRLEAKKAKAEAKKAERAAKAAAEGKPARAPKADKPAKAPKTQAEPVPRSDFDYQHHYMTTGPGVVVGFKITDLDTRLVKRVRASLNAEAVKSYRNVIEQSESKRGGEKGLPPIKVWVDDEGTPVIIGGWHRTEAYRTADGSNGEVPGEYVAAKDEGEAARLAIVDNTTNGQRLTRKDLHKAIRLALTDAALGGPQSDRAIAELVGCSHPTVAVIRSQLIEEGVPVPNAERQTSDGKTRKVAPKAEGEGPAETGRLSADVRAYNKARDYVLATAEPGAVAALFVELAKDVDRARQLFASVNQLDRVSLGRLADVIDRILDTSEEGEEIAEAVSERATVSAEATAAE